MIPRKPVPSAPIKIDPSLKEFVYDAPQKALVREFQLDLLPDGEDDQDAPLSGRIMSSTPTFYGVEGFTRAMMNSIPEDTESVRDKLSGTKEYLAMSYSWGDDAELSALHLTTVSCKLDDDNNVIMNHEPERNGYIWIRPNLRAFLVELRRRRERRFLWIDAICIEQSNAIDKDNQIKRMRHVYDEAAEVFVWLGEATEMELGALRILSNVTSKLKDCDIEAYTEFEQALDQVGLPHPEHELWKAYSSILTRGWWSRLWTLQEVVMAKEQENAIEYTDFYQAPRVSVLAGPSTTSWEQFDHFTEALAKAGLREWLVTGQHGAVWDHLHGIDAVAEVRTGRASKLRYGWAITPSAALLATRRRIASEPADMVFGQLALLDQATVKELALDIKMPVEEVFTRFGKHYIRNEVKECLLNHTATFEKLDGLPSWCPNFASREATVSLGSRWVGHYQERPWLKKQMPCAGFQKKGKWSLPRSKLYYARYIANSLQAKHSLHHLYRTNNPRQIALSPETDCIIVSALELDTVTEIVDCNPAAESTKFLAYNSIVQSHEWDQNCFKLAKDTLLASPDPITSSYYDIYARTLTANRVKMNPVQVLAKLEDDNDFKEPEDIIFDRYELTDFAEPYLNWKKYVQATLDAGETLDPRKNMNSTTKKFAACLAAMSKQRRFFATKGGKIGMGPSDAMPGDLIVVMFYCPTPYLIRPSQDVPGQWHFVGEAFVRGYMYGEALEMFDQGRLSERKFTIG